MYFFIFRWFDDCDKCCIEIYLIIFFIMLYIMKIIFNFKINLIGIVFLVFLNYNFYCCFFVYNYVMILKIYIKVDCDRGFS